MFVRRFSPLQTAVAPGNRLPPRAYGQTRGVRSVFHSVGVTNMLPHYNLSPAVKICHRYRRMRSSSASHKDYRLVITGVCSSRWPSFTSSWWRFETICSHSVSTVRTARPKTTRVVPAISGHSLALCSSQRLSSPLLVSVLSVFLFILFYLFICSNTIEHKIVLLKQLHEQDNKAVINSADSCPI